jgi:hypothetical protein
MSSFYTHKKTVSRTLAMQVQTTHHLQGETKSKESVSYWFHALSSKGAAEHPSSQIPEKMRYPEPSEEKASFPSPDNKIMTHLE